MRLLIAPHHGASHKALRQEAGTRRLFVTALNQALVESAWGGSAAPDAAPSDLAGFAAHALRDRFPPDIEEQIEQAWD
jgi:hypothetical protein